jgi:hypothetical protein
MTAASNGRYSNSTSFKPSLNGTMARTGRHGIVGVAEGDGSALLLPPSLAPSAGCCNAGISLALTRSAAAATVGAEATALTSVFAMVASLQRIIRRTSRDSKFSRSSFEGDEAEEANAEGELLSPLVSVLFVAVAVAMEANESEEDEAKPCPFGTKPPGTDAEDGDVQRPSAAFDDGRGGGGELRIISAVASAGPAKEESWRKTRV